MLGNKEIQTIIQQKVLIKSLSVPNNINKD